MNHTTHTPGGGTRPYANKCVCLRVNMRVCTCKMRDCAYVCIVFFRKPSNINALALLDNSFTISCHALA